MSRFDGKLWKRFLTIAQPYFFPLEPGSSRVFVMLLVLLMMFLFASMFFVISGVTLVSQATFPEFFNSIAPGLGEWIGGLLDSPFLLIFSLMLIVPLAVFFYYREQLIFRWQPWALLGWLLLLSISVSLLNVIISYVGKFFTTALAEKDQPTFWRFLFVYAAVFVVATPLVVIYGYVKPKLSLYWRDWLTNKWLDQYFQNRAYYEINCDDDIDNPDQRIAQDIESFTRTSVDFLLIILEAVIDIISFTGILWSISVPLSVILIIYAIAGTIITIALGSKLVPLNFRQLQKEADFRYGLVHIRSHAESIAFYRGEGPELIQIKQRFFQVFRNFNLLIGWQRNVSYFTVSYRYAVIILPSLIMAPIYFAGTIKYGDITQANFAFGQVLAAFSVVVSEIDRLGALAAGINRLATFSESLQGRQSRHHEKIETVIDDRIVFQGMTVNTPKHNQVLVEDLSAIVPPGEGLLIVGQSGTGKSSILRAIAGLWDSGNGRLTRPDLTEMLFLPQRPYMVLGNLRSQLLYPNLSQAIDDDELRFVLKLVNLEHLPEQVGGFDTILDWPDVLSLGEQQRLAFARLLLTQPKYAILDEATSALDLKNEAQLYQQLKATKTTFVSVGHRSSLVKYHQQVLELLGDRQWRLMSAQDYQP